MLRNDITSATDVATNIGSTLTSDKKSRDCEGTGENEGNHIDIDTKEWVGRYTGREVSRDTKQMRERGERGGRIIPRGKALMHFA